MSVGGTVVGGFGFGVDVASSGSAGGGVSVGVGDWEGVPGARLCTVWVASPVARNMPVPPNDFQPAGSPPCVTVYDAPAGTHSPLSSGAGFLLA